MLRLDPTIGLAIVVAGALLFSAAGAHKLFDTDAFTSALRRYDLLPESVVPPAARALSIFEIIVASMLVLPFTRMWAAVAGVALLAVYAWGIAVNLRRGRRELDCGCIGFGRQRRIGGWMVWRNAVIAGLLLTTLLPWGSRPWHWVDALTILCATLILALLYLTLDALWTESTSHHFTREPTT